MAKRRRAFIQAKPNPVPGGTSPGVTTVSWSTGNGSPGWVFVTTNIDNGEGQLFARGAVGFEDAPWIVAGAPRTFILYADEKRSQPLASVTVEIERVALPQPAAAFSPDGQGTGAHIRAAPNPVPASDDPGTTTISWSTGDGSPGWVFVIDRVGDERLFAHSAVGSEVVPWIIAAGSPYHFTLYGDEHRRHPLASVSVAMPPGQVGPLLGGRPKMHRSRVVGGQERCSDYDRLPNTVVTDRILAAPLLAQRCRGGSQVIPLEGGYLCLVHDETVTFGDGGRAYLHRWVWFDSKWRLVKLSPPFFFQEPTVEFAAGLVRRGDELIISYGVWDREAWLATVDTAEVFSLLAAPLDPRAETRAMRAKAARLPATRTTISSVGDPTTEACQTEWWRPTFLQTVDAYDRGDRSQGLEACERLLSVDGLPPVIEKQTRRNAVFYTPSLAEVAPSFRTTEIEFPVAEGWSRFNPSVAADADGNLRMIVRSSNYEFTGHSSYFVHDEQKVTRTTNYLLELDASLQIASVRVIDDHAFRVEPLPYSITGFEDCRLIFRGGSWWFSANVLDHTFGNKRQMALLRLEEAAVAEMHLLSNGVARHEKNWMPVQPLDGSELYFIYTCFPTVLVKFDAVSGLSTPKSSSPVHTAPALPM